MGKPSSTGSLKRAGYYPARPTEDHLILQMSDSSQIPLALIDAGKGNPRRAAGDVEALAHSIERFGLLQPILVRRVGARYELLSGHRRVQAVQLLHRWHPQEPRYTVIAAAVRGADDSTAFLMLVSSQVHALAWAPIEEAAALDELQRSGRTLAQIAELLCKTEGWVSRRVRVHEDPVLGAFVQSGALPASVGEELLPVRHTAKRNELAERAASERWSQSRARRAVHSHMATLARALLRELGRTRPQDISDVVWADLDALRAKIAATVPMARDAAA